MPLQLYDKEKILDTCFNVFVENGYTNTTTAMLSNAAGISKALLFHHFDSKKKLYIRILERCFSKLSKELKEESFSDFTNFFEAKSTRGLNRIQYLRKHPKMSTLMYEAYGNTPEELKTEIATFTVKLRDEYRFVDEKREEMMRNLFRQIPLRDDVNGDDALELINIVDAYFRNEISRQLTNSQKIHDDQFWDELITRKKRFINILRYGIEEKGV